MLISQFGGNGLSGLQTDQNILTGFISEIDVRWSVEAVIRADGKTI